MVGDRENYAAAAELIKKARRILISGHLSPDGDSLGSMLALAKLLNNVGIEACATADVNALGKPGFLEGCEKIIPVRKLKRQKRKFDLLIAVDNSGFDRMPPEVKAVAEKLPRLCIDHHVTNNADFAEVSIVDPEASSAGELIWRFAKWMEWKLDRDIAEALWVALITDSGRFAYDSTKPGTLRAAGDLLKYGVRTALINDIIYGTFSRKSIELKRIAWRSLHIWKNRKVAEVTLTRDDFREVRGTKADAEDIIEIPRSIVRNEIALFFYQIPDRTKETRCSIRTRGDWDATELAGRFGGGGHRKASGCTIKAPLATAKRQMRAAVKEMLKGRKPEVRRAEPANQDSLEAPKAEPTKVEKAPKIEVAKVEKAPKIEATKVEKAPKIEVAKVEKAPKAEPTKIEVSGMAKQVSVEAEKAKPGSRDGN